MVKRLVTHYIIIETFSSLFSTLETLTTPPSTSLITDSTTRNTTAPSTTASTTPKTTSPSGVLLTIGVRFNSAQNLTDQDLLQVYKMITEKLGIILQQNNGINI
ncbi:uncharacterized protein LOC121849902 [Callorhinchus milii]|uniref:uncharacterized protein LOC121849902 n=1 Tax=Callorhinchus milii TaxID=7868 RepID=UPI001C3FD0CB|nr:uncharacterized protein LOC121849902 [Callorhinchus milii]